jgi:DNA-binding FadR family transcriptional regulator
MRIKNVHGNTLDHLGEAVVDGRYGSEGSLPPEPQLCAELGVSRTVVREAVKSLVAKGLLSTGPKVGTRVLPADRWNWFDPDVVTWYSRAGLSREFLRDLRELRAVVEPAAVRLAAERATAVDLAQLESALAGMQQAIEHGGDYVRHDLAFHHGLLVASHNRMLVQMGKAIGALLRTSFEISTRRPASAAQSLPLHRAILDAVRARKPDRAERAALTLIESAGRDIDAVLASRRKLPVLSSPPTRLAPRGGTRKRDAVGR